MRNFHRLAEGMNFSALLHAVMRQPELWNAHDIRTTFPGSPHSQADDILVRFNDLSQHQLTGEYTTSAGVSLMDQHESIWFPAAAKLPVRPILADLMRSVEGERLGRAIITRLAPGCAIAKHSDSGAHAEYYTRYQLMLRCAPGVIFTCEDEQVQMRSGEVWFFRNELEHEVFNGSAEDRIVMIVDIRHG